MKEIPYRGSGPTEFLEIKHHFWYYMVSTCFKQLVMEASIGTEDQNGTVSECRPRPVATEVAMFYTKCNACDSQQKRKTARPATKSQECIVLTQCRFKKNKRTIAYPAYPISYIYYSSNIMHNSVWSSAKYGKKQDQEGETDSGQGQVRHLGPWEAVNSVNQSVPLGSMLRENTWRDLSLSLICFNPALFGPNFTAIYQQPVMTWISFLLKSWNGLNFW